ncbi:hypothetical protein GJV26_17000 [Massilia dura]|uniref:Uncharacterized protein n=1 Tax=Pseudoduganella dura TaxID=321982 RepID=A0A6I3XLQ2_9BURK|nr:hypothetical protein [Pseudoduganella dura]MUI14142.1 hypothetical protein [Pseudoduganella dura]GGX76822.1 hypothetical protein GCM10007386_05010 [Pseudoduganella dura]
MSAAQIDRRDVPALHQPFSWTSPGAGGHDCAAFIALTMDVSRGIETCLQLVNSSNMERHANTMADPGTETPPVLDRIDTENLLRLAIVSARMLAADAERKMRHMAETVACKEAA